MKKRRYLIIVLSVLLIFVGSFTAFYFFNNNENAPQAKTKTFEELYGEYKPRLWAVENADKTNKVYLFGTIHVGIKEMYPLPSKIMESFNESKYLAVESNIIEIENDYDFAMQLMTLLMYSDGSTVKDHVSDETYKQLKAAAKRAGLTVRDADTFTTLYYYIFLDDSLDKTQFKYDYGVDRHLIDKAYKKNLKVLDIEDPISTFKLLATLSDEALELLLKSVLPNDFGGFRAKDSYSKTFKAWVNGNVDEVVDAEVDLMELTEEELVLYYEINKALLDTRNILMTDKVIEYLETGEIHFFAVGAAHYSGEAGIINQLIELGYNVIEITY